MPDLSIVICTYNGASRIGQVLDRVRSQSQTELFTWEVLVIDNNSTDDTKQVVESYQSDWSALQYVFETEQGLAFARSRGVREATGTWIAFLDDDTLPAADWLFQVHQFAQSHPQAGAFGGQIHGDYEVEPSPELKKVAMFLAIVERGSKPHLYDRVLPPGAGLIVQRKVWLEHVPERTTLVGRTTEAMLASEDIEAVLHIQNAGWEIWYNPEMHLYHQIPHWRMERSYVLKLVNGVGLARHHIRMTRWKFWQRPFVLPIYWFNDLRKIALHKIRYRQNEDLAIACEQQLLLSSLVSPFYLWRRALFSK